MERPFRWTPPDPLATARLVRERLLAPLTRRFEVRLVAIEAGAGFGKTTLLAQALAENRLRPLGDDAWLGCEAADASPSNVLAGLLRALHAEHDVGAQPTTDAVCEAVWAHAPAHVCLVLDDAHRLDPASPGWATLVALIDELPANGHVVVSGRVLGALPLRQLLIKDQAITLGESDLRLDDDELRAFAESNHLEPAALDGVAGWPALAALRATAGGTTDDDALLEELLAGLEPDARRQFAMVVAIGGGDAELLTAALEEPVDVRSLSALPLVRAVAGGALEPHALWRRVVSAELSPDEIRDARRRAAGACTARGDDRTAFELLTAAEDWEAALPVLFEAGHDQLDPPWPDTLARWRAMVPSDVSERAEVVYLDGLIERAADPWSARGRDAFESAVHRFRDAGDIARELGAGFRAAVGPWLTADRELFQANLDRLVELGASTYPALGQAARFCEAAIAEVDLAPERMLAALDAPFHLEPRLDFFFPLFHAFAYLLAGDGPEARVHAASAKSLASVVTGAWGTQLCVLADAVATWVSGDVNATSEKRLGDPGSRWSIAERVPTLAVGAVVAAHQGQIDEARRLLRQASELVPDVGNRDFLVGFLAVAEATILVAEGDEAAAGSILDAVRDQPSFHGATSGRALVWFGALPSLVSNRVAAFVDDLPAGPSRRRAMEAVEALRRVRAGDPPGDVALLDDGRALVTVLPIPLATELACGATASGDERGRVVIEALRSLAPRATREALQRVAGGGRDQVRRAASTLVAEIPIPPPDTLRVEALGPVRLLRGGELVGDRDWRRERVRHLLLLLVDRRALHREEAADQLWPDLDADAVANNLRTTLGYLHGILEPHRRRGEAPYLLQQDAGVLRLADDEYFTVDAWELERLLDRAANAEREGLVSTALTHLLDALALWRGPYLDGVATEPWAEPARRRMHERVAAAGIRASELLVAGGRAPEAARAALTAVEADPWSEAAYRVLVAAHLAGGNRGAAKQAIAACEAMLADLGVEPDTQTRELASQVEASG